MSRIIERRREIEDRVREVGNQLELPLDITTMQRTLGPKPNAQSPPHGTEVYVTKLPHDLMEDTLVPFFMQAGRIYKFRLMIRASGLSNRGCAYVTYETSEMAQCAISVLHKHEISPGVHIAVQRSIDNRRIFIGGIPEEKTKDQVWQELRRIGVRGIVEVIMYRSYIDRNLNRGFVFVEFSTHEEASRMRIEYKNAFIFGQRVQVDWSAPIQEIDAYTMSRVKKIFLRHLNVLQERDEFQEVVISVIGDDIAMEKVYKYRDYAFIHFTNRRDAQRALSLLKEYFKMSDVEVTWAKPAQPNKPSRTQRNKTVRHANRSTNRSLNKNSPWTSKVPQNGALDGSMIPGIANLESTFDRADDNTGEAQLQMNPLRLPMAQFLAIPPTYCNYCLHCMPGTPTEEECLETSKRILAALEL